MPRSSILALAAAAALVPGALADTLTLPASRDNSLFESTLPLSNGAGPYLFAGQTLFAGARRALIRFDLAPIPAGSTITAVELRANVSLISTPGGEVALHRLTADWGESTSNSGAPGGMGAPAAPGDATWDFRFFDTQPWTSPGGDFDPAAGASITVAAVGPVTWPSSSQLVADVQGWLDAPATNFGWLLVGRGEPGTAVRFDSRESLALANRPSLIVTFTPPAACPADFNQSGAVTVQDIFDFLAAYFSSDPAADFNQSGSVTVQDIFDFLAAYFTGC